MIHDLLPTLAQVGSGVVGVTAVGLSLLAYLRFRHTTYRRMLLPLVVSTALFTAAHGLVLLWPTHPPAIDALEPLAFTVLIVAVGRLVQLHPRISETLDGDDV